MNTRDEVWDSVLRQLALEGEFTRSDLGLSDETVYTVRRTLRGMETMGWIQRDSEQSPVWFPGPEGKKILRGCDGAE